jgi:phage FluMu protein Com
MSISKKGTPQKIKEVVTGDTDFDQLKKRIAKDNNLKRCKSCDQLLAKFDSENKTTNIQRKGLDIIADVTNMQVKCPSCGIVNNL